jgi:regulator of replication initiation timing
LKISPLLQNSFPFSDTVLEKDDNHTIVSTVPMAEGVWTGVDGVPRLRLYEEFAPYADLLNGQEVLPDGHVQGDVMPDTRVAGQLFDSVARPEKRDVLAKTMFNNADLTQNELGEISAGAKKHGSIAYRCRLEKTSGIWNGKPYEEIERGPYRFYHFAMVPQGAATPDDGVGFNLNSSGEKNDPLNNSAGDGSDKMTDQIEKLLQSVADLTTQISTLTAEIEEQKLKNAALESDHKKLQEAYDADKKLLQEAQETQRFEDFRKLLNAANRPENIAKKYYPEYQANPAGFQLAHPELMLQNSTTPEDLALKGVRLDNASVADRVGDARSDMNDHMKKLLNASRGIN